MELVNFTNCDIKDIYWLGYNHVVGIDCRYFDWRSMTFKSKTTTLWGMMHRKETMHLCYNANMFYLKRIYKNLLDNGSNVERFIVVMNTFIDGIISKLYEIEAKDNYIWQFVLLRNELNKSLLETGEFEEFYCCLDFC